MQNTVISSLAITLYLATAALLGHRFFNKSAPVQEQTLAAKRNFLGLGLIAVTLHAIALYQGLFSTSGLNLGFFNAISLISFLIALLILLASLTNPVENLGIFLLPMAALAILLELIFPVEHNLPTATALDLKLHILMSIMASSMLGIAAVHSIVLAIQDRQLRNKKPGGYIRALPPLQTMETLLFQMIGLGFFLHSLSLITGMIYLDDMFAQHVAHKTVLSIIAWFVFAILLWGRWRFGWRGTKAIRWTLAGFVTLLLAYLGSKWVLEILLGRG
jgi:ABC-type uncharacterized transport system permease subunit